MPISGHLTLSFAWESSLFGLNGEVMTKAIRGIALD